MNPLALSTMTRKWTFLPLLRTFSARSVLIQSMGWRFLKDIFRPEALGGLKLQALSTRLDMFTDIFFMEGQI